MHLLCALLAQSRSGAVTSPESTRLRDGVGEGRTPKRVGDGEKDRWTWGAIFTCAKPWRQERAGAYMQGDVQWLEGWGCIGVTKGLMPGRGP